MRLGSNPQKNSQKLKLDIQHRVIVVVFIPALDGYYKKALEVFRLCLTSLIENNNGNYKLTIVDNGSCSKLKDLLSSYSQEQIDCIIKHSTNIGKIDALIGAARGTREKYITLSDADILFRRGWSQEIMKVFNAFNKVGSVSPIPFRHGLYYGTSSVFKQIIFKKVKFRYTEIPENFEDHNRYLTSINWNQEQDPNNKWAVIEKNGIKAIIGSGHQVLTIKKDILFSSVPKEASLKLVGGNSEYKYVDEPIDKAGLMRLSVYKNKAYHMGNEVEEWMVEKVMLKNKDYSSDESDDSIQDLSGKSNRNFIKKVGQKAYGFRKAVLKKMFRLFYN